LSGLAGCIVIPGCSIHPSLRLRRSAAKSRWQNQRLTFAAATISNGWNGILSNGRLQNHFPNRPNHLNGGMHHANRRLAVHCIVKSERCCRDFVSRKTPSSESSIWHFALFIYCDDGWITMAETTSTAKRRLFSLEWVINTADVGHQSSGPILVAPWTQDFSTLVETILMDRRGLSGELGRSG
jgi:hypothetical protein